MGLHGDIDLLAFGRIGKSAVGSGVTAVSDVP